MVKKKNKTWKVAFIVLALLGVLWYVGGQFFSIFGENFIIDEYFSINSPAIHYDINRIGTFVTEEMKPYCTVLDGGKEAQCEDDRFKVSRSSNGAFILINDGFLRIFSDPQQTGGAKAEVTYKKNLKNREIEVMGNILQGGAEMLGQCITRTGNFRITAYLDDENEDLYHVFLYGEEVGTINTEGQNEFNLKFRGCGGRNDFNIDTISSQAYFSCDIDVDEIAFTDRFYAGSKVKLSKLPTDPSYVMELSHRPTKICPLSQPIVKKDLQTGDERVARFGTLYNNLVRNRLIEVGNDELLEIRYITDYTTGMEDSNCPTGQYEDSNGCRQVVLEREDVAIPIAEKEYILVGKNEILFTDSINVGRKTISVFQPQYLCGEEQPSASSGNPRKECWIIQANYGEKAINATYGTKTELDQYLSITTIPDAQSRNSIVERSTNNALLGINKEFITIENVGNIEKEYYTILNSKSKICFSVDNKLSTFESSESGVAITITRELLTNQTSKIENIGFNVGKSIYCINKETSQLGRINYEIIPFTKINNEIFFDDEKIIRNYEVITQPQRDEVPTIQPEPTITKLSLWQRIKNFIIGIFG